MAQRQYTTHPVPIANRIGKMKLKPGKEFHHPLIIRLTHWINSVALLIMIASGLRIFQASPVFPLEIPDYLTLGGWLGGARQWHFAAMWIFFANGLIYFFYNIISKHGRKTTFFNRSDVGGVLPMVLYYVRIRKEHPPQKKYNALQKLTYTLVPLLALGSILSGIAIYWPVQCKFITALFGNYDSARGWHFFFTCAFVMFTLGHLFMVSISGWWNFWSMISGWKKISPAKNSPSPQPLKE